MDKKTAQSRKAYNLMAKDYESTFDGQYTRRFKEELLKAVELQKGYRILDVACGTGTLLDAFHRRESIEGYGVDIAEKMIEEAKRRYPEINFQVANSDALPFPDDFFDALTVNAAFHHFSKPRQFAGEAYRVLKNGGALYIAEVHSPPIIRQLFNALLIFYNAGDVKIYSKKELAGIFAAAGFRDAVFTTKGTLMIYEFNVSNKVRLKKRP